MVARVLHRVPSLAKRMQAATDPIPTHEPSPRVRNLGQMVRNQPNVKKGKIVPSRKPRLLLLDNDNKFADTEAEFFHGCTVDNGLVFNQPHPVVEIQVIGSITHRDPECVV